MAFWLQYYDGFYDRARNQYLVSDIDVVKLWMVDYDIIVDAFLVWYDRKEEQKRKETPKKPHEAAGPKASDHPLEFKPAHK